MSTERRLRLWALVVAEARGATVSVEHACAVAVAVAGVDCAAVAVSLRDTPREVLGASNVVASHLEELALTLGEGPSVDAISGAPALVADLAAPHCQARWPIFAKAAMAIGVHAVFALPLQIGGIRLGVLDLYRLRAGKLDDEQLADALVMADTVRAMLLDGLPEKRPDQDNQWTEQSGLRHPEVHQATGMISVQLGSVSRIMNLAR
ncbi:GAF domain-containing protein [Micromonospora sp. NPDC050795]|uniref:GAF domain-containing protein n=1 Tax=Micromonospora sp. NPDC050795 TaxID=3364282 RepID=UPI003789B1CB